jgi:hypothetical protein
MTAAARVHAAIVSAPSLRAACEALAAELRSPALGQRERERLEELAADLIREKFGS